ncbi:MAG: N-acetylmuramoyl-L-alanine amidase [Rhodospirillales bacterium]|nr:N-acetylmuramoyl-L-alanine amidase [Rhodospirillales bacterium]
MRLTAGGALALLAGSAAARPRREHVIVLDAGHGGIDPGAIGVSGVYEKDVVFAVTREAARLLDAQRGFKVVLTRDSDEFVALRERVRRARAAGASLFLSIHADALPNASMRGASVFTLSEKASDKLAEALAARENKVDLIAGIDLSQQSPEVSSILIDLARRQTTNDSIRLARTLVRELGRNVPLLRDGLHSAGFAVLKAPDVPSALVETGCLSNRQEEKLLRSPSYQRKIAAILARAIEAHFGRTA